MGHLHKAFEMFPACCDWLCELKRRSPEHMSEVDRALQVLNGKPGVDRRYEGLLFKMNETLSRLQDRKARLIDASEHAPDNRTACGLRSKAKELGYIIQSLKWIESRNSEIIKLIQERNGATHEQIDQR